MAQRCAGRGIGAVQVMNVHQHFAAGRLVEVQKGWTYAPLPMHAIYPSARFMPARVKALVSLVEQRIKTVPGIR